MLDESLKNLVVIQPMTYPPKVCTLISKQGVGEEQKEQNLSHTVKVSEMKELPLNEQNTEV